MAAGLRPDPAALGDQFFEWFDCHRNISLIGSCSELTSAFRSAFRFDPTSDDERWRPHSRGMTFTAYDAIVKDALLPLFFGSMEDASVSTADGWCGWDIVSRRKEDEVDTDAHGDDVVADNDGPVEQSADGAVEKNATTPDENEVNELLQKSMATTNYNDRSGKQKVCCLIAVVHGRVRRRKRTVKIGVIGPANSA